MSTEALSEELRDALGACPTTGHGVNDWHFNTARLLHRCGIDPERMFELLEEGSSDCGRHVPAYEIERAIRRAAPEATRAWLESNPERKRTDTVEPCYDRIEQVAMAGISAAELEEASPVRLDPKKRNTTYLIETLLRDIECPDPWICAGTRKDRFSTKRLSEWGDALGSWQFVVPNPMNAKYGFNQEGNPSERCRNNVGPRRFLVVELDLVQTDNPDDPESAMLARLKAQGKSVFDVSAAVHGYLASIFPLAMAVHSGNKSTHAWFFVQGLSEEESIEPFFRNALSLGADPATKRPEQLVRMPDALRDNGNLQRVIYLNPAVIGGGVQ